MVAFTINGKPGTAESGTVILEAAAAMGIEIPSLCYLKEINQIASCRVCVVEIEGYDTLPPACSTTVRDGMVIQTESPKVIAARKTVLNLLLATHNQLCFSCLKNTACQLQAICNRYGIEHSCYKADRPISIPIFGGGLVYRSDLCIRCHRCVSACEKLAGKASVNPVKDGVFTLIDMPFVRPEEQEFCRSCGKCADCCPVGALMKDGVSCRQFVPRHGFG